MECRLSLLYNLNARAHAHRERERTEEKKEERKKERKKERKRERESSYIYNTATALGLLMMNYFDIEHHIRMYMILKSIYFTELCQVPSDVVLRGISLPVP